MTSLSAQQSREGPDDSFISFKRHQRHRFSRPHQYYQYHAADHSTICPTVFTPRGPIGSADDCNSDRGFLKTGGGDSFADYDNVIPFVRLDRIAEDETDREDCSINNVHYGNAEWRGSPDARAGDRDRVTTQDTSRDLDGESCLSSQRCKDSRSSCSYHCDRNDVCENSVVSSSVTFCASTDNESSMGNALFTSHSDRVANSSSSSGCVKINLGKCTLARSTSGTYTAVGNTTTSSPASFDTEYPDIKCTQSSEMVLSSFTSDVLVKECDSISTHESVDLSTHYQGRYSTFTKAIVDGDFSKSHGTSERSCGFISEEIPSEKETASSNNARACDSRPEVSNSRTSSKSTPEKDSSIVSATIKQTRPLASTEERDQWEQTVSERKAYTKRRLSYDEDISKEAGNGQHVHVGKTPVIIITTSTPKKKPSKASAYTELSDSLGKVNVASNLPPYKGEKTNGINKDSKNEHNTQKNQASSLEYRHSNGRQKDETVRSAPLYGLSDPPPSISNSDLEFIVKDTSEVAVSYVSATVVDQHSSCPEHRTDSYMVKGVTPLPEVTDGLNLSNEEHLMNLSYTTATTKAASIAVATTKEIITFTAIKTQGKYSGPHTAEECKMNSYIDRSQAKYNAEDIHQAAMDDSLGDYAMPCDVRQEAAVILSHLDCTEVNMAELSIANEERSDRTHRELHQRLIEGDSVSLSEPQYTEISEATEPKINKSSLGRFKVGSDSTHYRVLRMPDLSDCHEDASEADAIYAIPIPKSQRKTQQSNISTAKPSTNSKQLLAQSDSPPKPARSPICNLGSPVFEDTDTVCDTHGAGNKVRVTCQMKQTTSTGRFYSDSSDYDYSNIPKFGRYEFFSLGRRPKRLRGNALRNSKEVSVSLEMLLKLRHESSADRSVSRPVDQTVSVDDILRSCREFEQSHVYYRGRASSDSVNNSHLCSLSFVDMANIKNHANDNNQSENRTLHQFTTFKKNDISNKQNSALKVNGDIVAHSNQHDTNASRRIENGNWVQPSHATYVKLVSTSSSETNYGGGQKSQRIEGKMLLDGLANGLHEQLMFPSNIEAKDTPDSAQIRFDSSISRSTQSVVHNEEVKDVSKKSVINYASRSDEALDNCDYDSQETFQTSASAPPNGQLSSFLHSRGMASYHDHVGINHQTQPEDALNLYSQRCFPVSYNQNPLEVSVPGETEVQSANVDSTHGTLRYQLPTQSLALCSAEMQYHVFVSSEDCPEHQSPEQTIPHIPRATLSNIDHAESPMSSSDMTSPESPGSIWSTSDGGFSPGVVSSGSVDAFSGTSVGELQSSSQKSPFCYARLEIVEALKWLRAAGFPQYAQMFEEGQFPVDMGVIERDHDFLDQDSLRSLFRRLEKLNKYAGLSLDTLPGKKAAKEEEDEEDLCALSDRWEYRKSVRRWSRKGVTSSSKQAAVMGSDRTEVTRHSDSHDSLLDQDLDSAMEDSALSKVKQHSREQNSSAYLPTDTHPENVNRRQDLNDALISTSPIPATNEKNKPSQNVFRKMEGLKNKRSRGMSKRRNIVDISGPIVEDSEHLRAKLERLNCVDISPTMKTSRRQISVGGKASNLGTAAASADRKSNQMSSEISTSHIWVQSAPLGTNSHIPVQSASTSHVSVHSPSSSVIPVNSPPTSHTPVQSPSSSHISVQSPSSSHFLLQSSTCSSSKATLSRKKSRPTETTSSTPFHSGILKQSVIHDRDISSASQTPAERDLKLESRNHTAEIHSSSLLPVQTDRLLEDAINGLDFKEVTPRAEEHHQPGRFPRILQNGYVENERYDAGAGVGNNTFQYSNTYAMEEPRPYSSGLRHRKSIYDNIQSDSKQEGQETARMIFPGIYKLRNSDREINSKDNSKELMKRSGQSNVEVTYGAFTHDLKSEHNQRDLGTVSLDASVVSSSEGSCEKTYGSSVYNRSVSLETSSFESPGDSTARSEAGISNTEARSDTKTSADSAISKSKGVVHSSSLDSYFQDINGDFGLIGTESRESPRRMIAQKEYDDFDVILQQLYQNINELSDYVSRETDINNSLEFDGVLDQDQENSFSGGEGSNTAESSSEDPEVNATDVSRDSLDQIPPVSRERRDSGVGHSLPRAPSERRQKKLRWNSFQNSHKPDINCRAMQINHLTVYQMVRLQKLCLLKLTAIMEKCLPVSRSGWNWMMPRFMKKQKTQDFINRKVFGVPLSVIAQRTGQPLPQCVLYAMRYLRRTSPNAVGIFRKSGVKSKIQQLRDYLESHPDTVDFEDVNAYSVADMLKTYFRDLPECLLTDKMSEIFRSIYLHVPPAQRLEALQTAIILLPDENREVLQSILLFLSDISSHEADHQMNANNLAVCFTPTVFQLVPQQTPTQSPKRTHKTSIAVPDPREMMEQKAAHECLLMMILECKKLFTVLPGLYRQLQVHSETKVMPVPLLDISCTPSDVRAFGQERIQIILKEAHDKTRGWLQAFTVGDVEVSHRKPLDDCPLKEWKLIVEIEAPPIEVLHRILHERHVWDEDLLSWSVVERLDPHSDIFQFVLNSMAPHPFRHFCVLRYWRSDLNKGACALITKSVEHSDPMEVQGVWAVDLGSYFLMEHCGSGRSRLTYITRLDTRGRSPEWYTRIFGHISANFLARLKESFRQVTLGPETRV